MNAYAAKIGMKSSHFVNPHGLSAPGHVSTARDLALLPVGNKLKTLVNAQALEREMIVEGLIAIAQGENPRNIETSLAGFVG